MDAQSYLEELSRSEYVRIVMYVVIPGAVALTAAVVDLGTGRSDSRGPFILADDVDALLILTATLFTCGVFLSRHINLRSVTSLSRE